MAPLFVPNLRCMKAFGPPREWVEVWRQPGPGLPVH